ncbi:DoxX family protein [Paenibacillus farraposensis]|uniref:DoxX family protein n=1 Tax=Paenibacillus farraposensis TaxID=2807095 RepID=A0ABW4DB50_9BACL|nr:DoxX family protein [Paenibacillus farraposensis]MCC3380963.1 DoxX family protein [Paenibacillus farraposensis]
MEQTWVILFQFILIVMFSVSASLKFFQTPSMVRHWNQYNYPMWAMFVVAAGELIGVLIMITTIWVPGNKDYAAALFIVLMLGAIHAHLVRAKHKPIMAVNAILMLGLSVTLLFQ